MLVIIACGSGAVHCGSVAFRSSMHCCGVSPSEPRGCGDSPSLCFVADLCVNILSLRAMAQENIYPLGPHSGPLRVVTVPRLHNLCPSLHCSRASPSVPRGCGDSPSSRRTARPVFVCNVGVWRFARPCTVVAFRPQRREVVAIRLPWASEQICASTYCPF